jgi:hypothetical protein
MNEHQTGRKTSAHDEKKKRKYEAKSLGIFTKSHRKKGDSFAIPKGFSLDVERREKKRVYLTHGNKRSPRTKLAHSKPQQRFFARVRRKQAKKKKKKRSDHFTHEQRPTRPTPAPNRSSAQGL